MALYRTKPEEVEAIQYTGNISAPFSEQPPQWLWMAVAGGNVSIKPSHMVVQYNGMQEDVMPNDWLVLQSDGIIRACSEDVFSMFYEKRGPKRPRKHKDGAEVDGIQGEGN